MNRILIVDDTGDNVKLIKAMLKSLDSDIDVAVDGEEALRKMTDNDYDIVLLDIMLPKVSGIDVLKKVRERDLETPIIVMTAYGSEELAVETLREGGDDYLINKPIRTEDLLDAINKALEKRKSKKIEDDFTNEDAYSMISEFENSLREFILEALKRKYGASWWERGIPNFIKAICLKRQNDAIVRKREVYPPLFYTDFSHYLPIILFKNNEKEIDNWKDVFEYYFVSIGWIKGRLIELTEIRNEIVHPKKISKRQFKKMKLYIDEITEYMDRPND
ncbi:MAG TPA: response regulator [Methanofastidiosum sp.]|nr:response regulator [Methanofastidiosum sp.]HQK63366.1 response regulator [Methanofastidiosum sp.]